MKILWILLGVGAVAVLIGAFFALNSYIYNEKQGGSDGTNVAVGTTVELEGSVHAINLTQIILDGPAFIDFTGPTGKIHTVAIPSMGLGFCPANNQIDSVNTVREGDSISVRGVIDEMGNIVPCDDASHYFRIGLGTYVDPVHGYQFTYEKGMDGYVFAATEEDQEEPTFRSGLGLMSYVDFTELEMSTEPREGPPMMAVRVYENDAKRSANLWVDDNPQESNIALTLGEPDDVVVGGANAVRYTVDGLYSTETYVVAHGGYIYVISGSYLDTESDIYRDFQALLASFKFLPIPSQLQPDEEVPQVEINTNTDAMIDVNTSAPQSE